MRHTALGKSGLLKPSSFIVFFSISGRLLRYYHISRKRCRKYNFIEVPDPVWYCFVPNCTPQAPKVGDIVPHTPPGDAAHIWGAL